MDKNHQEEHQDFKADNNVSEDINKEKLWGKITNYAQKAGIKVIYSVLLMWYAYQRKDTPDWAKRIILGALAYFVSPIDMLLNLPPFIGFTDDLGILGMGLVAIAACGNDGVRQQAKERLSKWFKDYNNEALKEVDDKL